MAMVTMPMAMATVITGMATRMDRVAGILPEQRIPAHTPAGMPDQAEDLRVFKPADTAGLRPPQDIRAERPPPRGDINLGRRQRDMPPRERHLEQVARARQELLRPGDAKRPGLSRQGPPLRGLPGLARR
jgi:hypothetical protein